MLVYRILKQGYEEEQAKIAALPETYYLPRCTCVLPRENDECDPWCRCYNCLGGESDDENVDKVDIYTALRERSERKHLESLKKKAESAVDATPEEEDEVVEVWPGTSIASPEVVEVWSGTSASSPGQILSNTPAEEEQTVIEESLEANITGPSHILINTMDLTSSLCTPTTETSAVCEVNEMISNVLSESAPQPLAVASTRNHANTYLVFSQQSVMSHSSYPRTATKFPTVTNRALNLQELHTVYGSSYSAKCIVNRA